MKILLSFILLLSIQSIAFSEVYVYSDKNTNNVLFITEKSSVVIDPSDTNIQENILANNIEFYNLTESYDNYKFQNNKFVLNTQKISDMEAEKTQQEADKIKRENDFESAKAKLIVLGLTAAEVESLK